MSESLLKLPLFPRVVVPSVTVASLAVYGVMGGLGYGLSHVKRASHLGEGLIVAAFIGAGYAISHAVVTNIAPETAQTLSGNGQKDGVL